MKLSRFLPIVVMVSALPALSDAQVLTLESAVEQSLAQHLGLRIYQHRTSAADAQLQQSTVGSRPELNLTVEDVLGSGDHTGTDLAQSTLSIAWVLEGGLLKSREERALSEISVLTTETKTKRLDIAAETARRFSNALLLQERELLARESERQASRLADQIQRRVDVGKSPASDALRASAIHAERRLILEDIDHEKRVAYRELASQWGKRSPEFDQVDGSFSNMGNLQPYEDLQGKMESNPALRLMTDKARLADSELALAKAEARSRWRVNAGLRHYAANDDTALVAGLTIPLGGEKRNQGSIDAAAAQRRMVDAEKDVLSIELDTRLYSLHQQWQHAAHVASTLQTDILPLLYKAAAQAEQAYDRGRANYQELATIQQELLDARSSLLDTRHRAHLNRIEIERLLGVSLSSTDGTTP